MTTVVIMPEVAETVVEGTVARWLKKEGDRVELNEPLVEVVTDKVNVEVPSPAAGVLVKIVAPVNAVVPVRGQLALIEDTRPAPAAAPAAVPAAPGEAEAHPRLAEEAARPFYSPLVQRLAEEHGVNLDEVKGTGAAGRVTKQDVLDYAARRQAVPPAPAPPAPAAVPARPSAQEEIVPLTPIRATIAQRMARSKREIPHVWTMMEVDVTELVKLRESLKDEFRTKEGAPLTYLPFVIKAVVGALKEHPMMNSSWAEDKIIVKRYINIGVAVDREEGLIVPVVRNADQKSIAGLARELNGLITRARENKLTVADVQGGTFTINNTGAIGSLLSTPIINQPQAAILTSESIVKRPVVRSDAIAIRSIMNVCISFDHRVLDGGIVARFMSSVKRSLQAYGPGTAIY